MAKTKMPQWATEIKDAGGVNGGTSTRWEPAAGDLLVGTVASYHEFDGKYGPTWILTVTTEDGDRSYLLSHTVLKQELAKWANKFQHQDGRLEVGTELVIEYLGELKAKDGNNRFHGYNVYAREAPLDTPF